MLIFAGLTGGVALNCGSSSSSIVPAAPGINTNLNQGPNPRVPEPKKVLDLNNMDATASPTGSLLNVATKKDALDKLAELVEIAVRAIRPSDDRDQQGPPNPSIFPADIFLQSILMGTLMGDVAVNDCVTATQACLQDVADPLANTLDPKFPAADASCTMDSQVITLQEILDSAAAAPGNADITANCAVVSDSSGRVDVDLNDHWGATDVGGTAVQRIIGGNIRVQGLMVAPATPMADTKDITVAGLSTDLTMSDGTSFSGARNSVINAYIPNYNTVTDTCGAGATQVQDCPIVLGVNAQFGAIKTAMLFALPNGINQVATNQATMLIDSAGKTFGLALNDAHSLKIVLSGHATDACLPCNDNACSAPTLVGTNCCEIDIANSANDIWEIIAITKYGSATCENTGATLGLLVGDTFSASDVPWGVVECGTAAEDDGGVDGGDFAGGDPQCVDALDPSETY